MGLELATLDYRLLVILFVFVFCAYFVQSLTGFGSVIVLMGLGLFLFNKEILKEVAVPLSIIQCFILVYKNYKNINTTVLKMLLSFMVVGLGIGMGLNPYVNDRSAKLVFGIFATFMAGRELLKAFRRPIEAQVKLNQLPFVKKIWIYILTIGAGVIHGILAAGGLLLTIVTGT